MWAKGYEEPSGHQEPGCDYLFRKCFLVSCGVCKQDARLFSEGLLANKVDKSQSLRGCQPLAQIPVLNLLTQVRAVVLRSGGPTPEDSPLTVISSWGTIGYPPRTCRPQFPCMQNQGCTHWPFPIPSVGSSLG